MFPAEVAEEVTNQARSVAISFVADFNWSGSTWSWRGTLVSPRKASLLSSSLLSSPARLSRWHHWCRRRRRCSYFWQLDTSRSWAIGTTGDCKGLATPTGRSSLSRLILNTTPLLSLLDFFGWPSFIEQELLLLSSSPSTIHSEGWIVDWVDRACDFEMEDGWFPIIEFPMEALKISLYSNFSTQFLNLLWTLSCGRSYGQPGWADHQHHWSKHPWICLWGQYQAYPTANHMSDQAAGGRGRTMSRSENLQYLGLIQVLLQKSTGSERSPAGDCRGPRAELEGQAHLRDGRCHWQDHLWVLIWLPIPTCCQGRLLSQDNMISDIWSDSPVHFVLIFVNPLGIRES